MEGSLDSVGITNASIIQVINTVRKDPRWHGRWIVDTDWCELLRRSAPVLASIDKTKLNNAIAKSNLKYGFEVEDVNPIGFLRRRSQVGGIRTRYYFASVPGTTVPYPSDDVPWFSQVKPIIWIREDLIPQVIVADADSGSAKRQRPASVALPLQSSAAKRRILEETAWWDSTEARRLFASREDDVSTHVLKVIEKRLTLLRSTETGYKSLVEGHDPHDLLSEEDIFVLRLKAQYLHTALDFASKEWMPGSVTWADCCEKAIAHMAMTGIKYCTRAQTLMDWHKHLQMNNTLLEPLEDDFCGGVSY
jgi:hypothetical protein